MSTTNNTATLVAAFEARMNYIAQTLAAEQLRDIPSVDQMQVLQSYLDNPKDELFDVARDLNLMDDVEAALAELTNDAPKEQDTVFMSWKHLSESARIQAESDYRTFFLLHPDQKNPTDPNTDEKWEYMGIIGRKRYAAMNAARKAKMPFTKANHWTVSCCKGGAW